MMISYRLSADDHLMYLLYVASGSNLVKKRRFRAKVMPPVIFLLTGFLLYYKNAEYLGLVLFTVPAVLWFFFYPKWENWYYLRHYKAFIKEHQRGDENLTLEVENDNIHVKDSSSEGTVSTSEIESINEISTIFLIMLKGGKAFIIPKSQTDTSSVRQRLKDLAQHLNISYIQDDSWKWS